MLEDIQTPEHTDFRERFRGFVSREISPFVRQWEDAGGMPRELWRKMGQEGFLCPRLPAEYGGLGLGYDYSVIIGEELVRGDAFGTGIPLHNDVVVPYILRHGSEELKRRWLPLCLRGEAVCSIGLTEPGAGSDLSAIKTHAVRDGDHYRINGQKTFITNGISADLVVLAVKTDLESPFFGTSLILVEADSPGFSRGRKLKKMGCHLSDTAELFFEDCLVPARNLLGQEGLGARYLLEALPEERLEVALKCQVMAEEILKEALKESGRRLESGLPVGRQQHWTFQLAEMATEVELGRTFLDRLLVDYLAQKDIVEKTAMAKYWLTEMVNRAAYQALQLCGELGLLDDSRLSRIYRDVRVTPIYAGTNEIMKLLIGRSLGLRPR